MDYCRTDDLNSEHPDFFDNSDFELMAFGTRIS